MKHYPLNHMEYGKKYMEMVEANASNYESFDGGDSFGDDSFEESYGDDGYADEYAGRPQGAKLEDSNRIITFNISNAATYQQTALLFGANVYDLNNTTLYPASLSIQVAESSHYQVRQSSVGNPVVFDYWRLILNDSTTAQFGNVMTYAMKSNAGMVVSATISPNTYVSAFQFQTPIREAKYRMLISGDHFVSIPCNAGTSFTLIFQKGMEMNIDKALSGRAVVESNKKMLGTLPTQNLVVSKR